MTRVLLVLLQLVLLPAVTLSVCDGNPHKWGRLRRCDQRAAGCPDAPWAGPKLCEGIGGLASSDDASDPRSFNATSCEPVMTPAQLNATGATPVPPIWPATFVNTRFFEEQIFVHRDPFCLAQIPAMVSNGSHCYKRQEGSFNYDSTVGSLRIDYTQASAVVFPWNMTEYFYHLPDGTVHPSITRDGKIPIPVCPCIQLGIGPVSPTWAADAQFVGRERLGIEFLWETRLVDHFVKGPHHVWTDVVTRNVVRMWQPFNGLEVFDPMQYHNTSSGPLSPSTFVLPAQCVLEAKLGCINGTSAQLGVDGDAALVRAFGGVRRR